MISLITNDDSLLMKYLGKRITKFIEEFLKVTVLEEIP